METGFRVFSSWGSSTLIVDPFMFILKKARKIYHMHTGKTFIKVSLTFIAKLSTSSSFSSAELALISRFAPAVHPAVHPSEYQTGYIW